MQTHHRLLSTFLIALFTAFGGAASAASLESEQAVLTQLTQALEDAKASLKALEDESKASQQKAAQEQENVLAATTAKEAAKVNLDTLTAQQAAKPSPDTGRKRKDAEVELMMAERKLSSAQKTLERAEKKIQDSSGEQKSLQQQIAQTEKSVTEQKALIEKMKTNSNSQANQKAAEAAAQKAAEEQAKQIAAAAEQARQQAAAEEQAKKQALMKQLSVDLSNCQALPANVAITELTAVDMQLQAFAQGELRRVNRLLEEKLDGDTPPLSPSPLLSGSKLKPCDPEQWQALKFSYLGNGQYRLETPVLAGEQEFHVKGVIESLQRVIPDSDNGAVYVFFLDVKFEGRYKLSAYKKALFDQAPPQ